MTTPFTEKEIEVDGERLSNLYKVTQLVHGRVAQPTL